MTDMASQTWLVAGSATPAVSPSTSTNAPASGNAPDFGNSPVNVALQPRQGWSPWPFRMAMTTLATTLGLILVGGLVTSTASGDTEPDWPLSREFKLEYGWLIEMGHRAVAMVVAAMTWVLALVLARHDNRPLVRRLGWVAVAAVMAQAGLGGLRIIFPDDTYPQQRAVIGIVHTCVAQGFFCLLTALTVVTSRTWWATPSRPPTATEPAVSAVDPTGGITPLIDNPWAGGIVRAAALAVPVGLYLQIVLGAVVRHTGGAVALHVVMALLVVGLAGIVSVVVLSRYAAVRPLAISAGSLGGLLVAQLTLGLWSLVLFDRAGRTISAKALVPTLHVVIGVSCLAVSVMLALWLYRAVGLSANDADPASDAPRLPLQPQPTAAAPNPSAWPLVAAHRQTA